MKKYFILSIAMILYLYCSIALFENTWNVTYFSKAGKETLIIITPMLILLSVPIVELMKLREE